MCRAITVGVIIAILGIFALMTMVSANADAPQISMSFENGRWIVNINYNGPITVSLNGQAVQQPAPILAAPAPSGGQLAYGSCLVNGQQFDLVWDPGSRKLYMDPWLGIARDANRYQAIPCHVKALSPGFVEAIGQRFSLAPWQDWYFTFPVNDPSLGFAFQAN